LSKFFGGVWYDQGTNEFNFGDDPDPDHRPDPANMAKKELKN